MTAPHARAPGRPGGLGWLLAGIVLVAVNLRPAITSVGPLLGEIRVDLDLSGAAAGLLTTLPVLCLGVFAPLAAVLGRRFDLKVVLVACLPVLTAGILLRSGPSMWTLFGGTVIIGAAIGVANVVVPGLIKQIFPLRIALVTAVYTTVLNVSSAAAAGAMVPVGTALDAGWRLPLGLLAVPAVIAALYWVPLLRGASAHQPEASRIRGLWGNPLVWQVTTFMGCQSMLAYVVFGWLPTIVEGHGMSAATAGLVLSVSNLVQAAGALSVPVLARRARDQRPLVLLVVGFTVVGLAGIVLIPAGVWVWAVVLGLGQGAGFGLALTLIGLRSYDDRVAIRLSGLAQTAGYLIAAVGPLMVGVLHDATGGWLVALAALLGVAAVETVTGLGAGRDRQVRASAPVNAASDS